MLGTVMVEVWPEMTEMVVGRGSSRTYLATAVPVIDKSQPKTEMLQIDFISEPTAPAVKVNLTF